MKKKSKHTLTPKLRFPEFRGPWETEVIGDYLVESRIPGSNGLSALKITVKLWGKGVYEKVESIKGSENTQYYKRRAGQFIYSKLDFLNQAFGIIPEHLDGFESTVDLPCFDVSGGLDPRFLVEYVKRPSFYKKHGDMADGGRKAKRIQVESFLSFPIAVPSPAEQQKIAECLSSLDGLIAAEGRKLAALRDHKRGLMQQLFPQPGQSQPRLRFPKFRNKGEWEEEPLGKIAEIKLGKMLDKNKHCSGRLLPYLNNLAVRWNDFDTSGLPEMYFNDDELDKYELRTGDVIVCEGGEPGRSAVWDERLPGLKYQKVLHRVRFKIQFLPHLLVHYLETIAGTPAFESLFTGGGIKHLTRQTFARLVIPIASPAEQQCIAGCLTALDTRIAAQAAKIESLKTHKRGLMQQLFPAPEENEA